MSSEDEISEQLAGLPRMTWATLPDLPQLSGPTILDCGRPFLLYTPTSVVKHAVDDGEDIMTALAHATLGECVPRVLGATTLSAPASAPGRPRPRAVEGLILTLQPGKPLVEVWPSFSVAQRATVKSRLCDLLFRMRVRPFDYYGRPLRQPYVLYNIYGRTIPHAHCRSRAEWDDTRVGALRASTSAPAERLPTLERVQRETHGAEGWDRPVITHVDLSEANILVDPDTLAVTGLIDWERANVMPAYFEYVAARLTGVHLPEWRKDLLDVLRAVLRRECGVIGAGGDNLESTPLGDADAAEEAEERYRKTLAAWHAMVDVERFAQGYDDKCYWTFDTGLPYAKPSQQTDSGVSSARATSYS